MPHIIVKLFSGRTEAQKKQLTSEIVKAIRTSIGAPDNSISLSIEEVPKKKWTEKVYKPDIIDKEHLLHKKPGYGPSL